MVAMSGTMTGGERLQAVLQHKAANLATAGSDPQVRVGFPEGALYPDGQSVAKIAAQNEFGATINRAPGTITVYRKVAASGTHFLRNGRFVKRGEANFESTHPYGAYTITIPPRPFFRTMIKKESPFWGGEMAKRLKANDFDAAKTLNQMGALIAGQLQQSIRDMNSPPNTPSTIRKKKSSKPLIDTGYLLASVDYEVSNPSGRGSFGGLASKLAAKQVKSEPIQKPTGVFGRFVNYIKSISR
jgi:hypothetical protein